MSIYFALHVDYGTIQPPLDESKHIAWSGQKIYEDPLLGRLRTLQFRFRWLRERLVHVGVFK